MADINFDCPHCGHNLDVNEKGAGLTVACPECSKSIEIPIPAPEVLVCDMIFNYGSCGQPLKAAPDMAGQLIDCPACKKPTDIPFAPRPTPPTPTHPAAIGMPIPKSPNQRQVPGFGTRTPAAPAATRPQKAASPGLVIAVIFLALVCAGLTAGMIFLIKNRNGGSTTDQGTPVAPSSGQSVTQSAPSISSETIAAPYIKKAQAKFKRRTIMDRPIYIQIIIATISVFGFVIIFGILGVVESNKIQKHQEELIEELMTCAIEAEILNTMANKTDFKVKYADGTVNIITAGRNSAAYTILISKI